MSLVPGQPKRRRPSHVTTSPTYDAPDERKAGPVGGRGTAGGKGPRWPPARAPSTASGLPSSPLHRRCGGSRRTGWRDWPATPRRPPRCWCDSSTPTRSCTSCTGRTCRPRSWTSRSGIRRKASGGTSGRPSRWRPGSGTRRSAPCPTGGGASSCSRGAAPAAQRDGRRGAEPGDPGGRHGPHGHRGDRRAGGPAGRRLMPGPVDAPHDRRAQRPGVLDGESRRMTPHPTPDRSGMEKRQHAA